MQSVTLTGSDTSCILSWQKILYREEGALYNSADISSSQIRRMLRKYNENVPKATRRGRRIIRNKREGDGPVELRRQGNYRAIRLVCRNVLLCFSRRAVRACLASESANQPGEFIIKSSSKPCDGPEKTLCRSMYKFQGERRSNF